MPRLTQSDLQAYLDEALAPGEMAAIEVELRNKPELLQQLSAINARRDAGVHSLGEIWRRNRLTCPSREQLGSYLLSVLDAWVSNGSAPGTLTASRMAAGGGTEFTRPLCNYPQYPRYTGPANDAAAATQASNYTCTTP